MVSDTDMPLGAGPAARQLGMAARARVRRRVQDPIAWVDLALAHTIQGFADLAEREIQVAIHLAPDSRFVLRSAARLLVHKERADEANYLLNTTARVSEDPWLLAAELSTAQLAFGKARRALEGRAMAARGAFAPLSLSELTSELATTELISGRDRQSRLLFEQSLSDPTENAIAQAVSQAYRTNLQLEPETLSMSRGFEARALEHARQGEWPAATEEAIHWLEDQPFSQEPYRFASFTTSFGSADYKNAARIAIEGLRHHPGDEMLRNNAAYALANLDQPAEARRFIRIPSDPTNEDMLTQLATMGLVHFREGDAETAARLYRLAIAGLEKLGRRDLAGVAASHLALEEMRLDLPGGAKTAEKALKLIRELNDSERRVLEERLKLAASVSSPQVVPRR
jgi:tetratricopeptide (TPR) repeat protein